MNETVSECVSQVVLSWQPCPRILFQSPKILYLIKNSVVEIISCLAHLYYNDSPNVLLGDFIIEINLTNPIS